MKTKNKTKALTQNSGHSLSIKAARVEVVWTHAEFGRELEKAKQIGPNKMSDTDLLRFCRGVNCYYHSHFWVDARPFFRELWHRINDGKLRMSKTEACRRIGCTPQWANAIVSGRADERRTVRAQAKAAKGGNLVSASTSLPTDEEFVDEILKRAFAKLEPLLSDHWDRYRSICGELAKHFEEASKTPLIAKAHGA